VYSYQSTKFQLAR